MAAAPEETLKTAPLEAVNPAGETVATAQPVETPPAPVAAVAAPAPVEVASLPKTASDLGLIGLSGLMLLGAGFLVSGLVKKDM
jgi:LPXTG-motif cell wall-anchored protein